LPRQPPINWAVKVLPTLLLFNSGKIYGFQYQCSKTAYIKIGSNGSAVSAWQSYLKEAEYPIGTVDGDFGKISDTATRSYQQRNNLPVTGVVDNTTYTKALSDGLFIKFRILRRHCC
jgi:peptidoglycan hydrolase-like protein with peptidoglycan-binding domain